MVEHQKLKQITPNSFLNELQLRKSSLKTVDNNSEHPYTKMYEGTRNKVYEKYVTLKQTSTKKLPDSISRSGFIRSNSDNLFYGPVINSHEKSKVVINYGVRSSSVANETSNHSRANFQVIQKTDSASTRPVDQSMKSDSLYKPLVEAYQSRQNFKQSKLSISSSASRPLEKQERGTFGMAHFTDRRFFKEYSAELYGQSSPGICKYNIQSYSAFAKAAQRKLKSISQDKRPGIIQEPPANEKRPEPGQYYISTSTLLRKNHGSKLFGTQAIRAMNAVNCKFLEFP